MKAKKLLVLLANISLVLALMALPFMGACAPEEKPPTPPAEPIELRYASYIPATHWAVEKIEGRWAKEVKEATEGKVKVTIYPGETLLKARETYDGVVRGVADVADIYVAFNPGRFPLSEAAGLPLGIPSSRVSSRVFWELYKEFPEFQAEYSEVKVLFTFCTGPGKLLTTKPVSSLEDLKGMKIRASGAWAAKTLKALGAIAVMMPTSDVYMSMERGVIDGALIPYDTIHGFKLYEVVTDITEVNLYQLLGVGFMNLDTWNGLASDIQQKIDEVSGDHAVASAAEAWGEAISAGKELALEADISIHELSPTEKARWDEICCSVVDEWVAEVESKGLPGIKFIDRLRELVEEYK